jgi:hypothetical protein
MIVLVRFFLLPQRFSLKVPSGYKYKGFNLGSWVKKQRSRKDKLTIERLNRLNQMGFVWKFK